MEVTIDGRKLELEEAVSALEAAGRLGISIPTLCWHPRISILGACRLCMIEVEGINRLLAACTTQVSDGMSILTDTPQLRKVRQTMLELLLCRHPLDCPTCVKGGECELQELAYGHAAPENRFPENPAPYPVRDPSPFVERDPKKCVLCRRCVRVCREVRGVTVLAAMERGYHKRVGTYFQKPLDSDFQEPYNCEFCGSCIDICPVGALNSKVQKFRARTWEGAKTDSVCPFCSVGCLLTLQVKENELVRTVPKVGPNNEDQACFRGRFGTDFANSSSRLVAPLIRRDGRAEPVDAEEAFAFAAAALASGKKVKAMISSSLTNEEIRAARDFTAALAPGAEMKAVDSLGMYETAVYDICAGAAWEDLEDADLVVAAGQDFTVYEPVAGVRIRVARQKSFSELIVLDGRDVLLGKEADLWLRPAGAGLPLLLGALLHQLASFHSDRLKGGAGKGVPPGIPGEDVAAAEKDLGLAEGAVAGLAARIAARGKVVFVGHRGWHDEEDRCGRLMKAIADLLTEGEGRVLYFGRDANSRGAARGLAGGAGEAGGAGLLLVFGADPIGTALPTAPAVKETGAAETVLLFDSFMTKTADAADAVFPLPHFAEKEGTFLAATGTAQKVQRAMASPSGVVPLWEHLEGIAEAAGQSLSFAPSLQEETGGGAEPESAPPTAGVFPGADQSVIVLCGIPIADHRLRLVAESGMLMPGEIVEVNPGDIEKLALADGLKAAIVSGGARLTRTVRGSLKVPPGQIHLPFDPEDEAAAAFAAAAELPQGWPPVLRRLTNIAATGGEGLS